MKPLFFSLLITLGVSMSIAAPSLHLTTTGQYLVLNTSEWNQSTHTVKIVDQEGQLIYSKEFYVKDANSFKKFNLEKLAEGTYQLEVDDLQYINRQYFTKSNTTIQLNETIESFVKPVVFLKGTSLMVNYLNLDHKSDIKILDPNNVILFEGKIENPVYTKQFNLSRLEKGVYTVVISQEKERFVKNIEL